MRAIQYAAPRSLSDAVAILQERGSKARILAGGTDLIVQVGENVRDVDTLVDGKHIPELMEISFDPITGLTLGAAVPCYRIYEHPEIQSHYSGLVDSASIIGGTGIQGRASIGGNLCNSGPAGDTIPTLIAYSAMARILGANGERNVAVEDFCTAPGRNILQPDELLVSIHFPAPPPISARRIYALYRVMRWILRWLAWAQALPLTMQERLSQRESLSPLSLLSRSTYQKSATSLRAISPQRNSSQRRETSPEASSRPYRICAERRRTANT